MFANTLQMAFGKIKQIVIFFLGFLYPFAGVLIWWFAKTKQKEVYKKPALYGAFAAMLLFVGEYLYLMMS